MQMMVCFFVGLVLLFSGSEIGALCKILSVGLLCNVIGGLLMGYGVYLFLKKREREDKEKQENILSMQKQLFKEYQKNAINKDDVMQKLEGISEGISEEIAGIRKVLSEEIVEKLGMQISYMEDMEELKKLLKNWMKNEKTALNEIKGEMENLSDVIKNQDGLKEIPGIVSDSVEELIGKFNTFIGGLQTDFKHLEEDLEEQDRNRTKVTKSILEEIRTATEERNEELAGHMELLAEQYKQFEKTISAIVQQMSDMAQDDLKIMKGFLNGKS